ncbi:hypothetical protein Q0M94_21605 (plasmid) [Deinococcus radiomollis]|uniref:hypothetical protein n=1 Tax=Deinococcus radiomollis TaxID=468916 RepID=UPI0038920168
MTRLRTDADLLEIIRKQAEQIEQLIAENAQLRKRIEELERQGRKYVAPHFSSGQLRIFAVLDGKALRFPSVPRQE